MLTLTARLLVDYANGWAEVNGCYELATSMHEQGASLIYQHRQRRRPGYPSMPARRRTS